MIIKKLILNNHAQLVLNPKNKHFILEPSSDIILILGANGSGKTTILRECSPLPASKNDYLEGGYKHIEIEHKKSYYKLRSDFTDGQRHSFNKDGVELNQSGTVSIQKELVRQYFNLTTDIFSMINNEYGSTLTTMSPTERRKWFTLMDKTDYGFILRKYNKAKDQLRDAQGAVKTLSNRLLIETQSKVSTEAHVTLKEQVTTKRHQLGVLIEQKSSLDLSLNDATKQLSETCDKYLLEARAIRQINKKLKNRVLSNEDMLMPEKGLGVVVEKLKQVDEKLHKTKEVATALQITLQTASLDTGQLDVEIAELQEVLIELNKNIIYKEIEDEDLKLLAVLDTVLNTLKAIVAELPHDTDRKYTTQALQFLDRTTESLEYDISQTTTKMIVAETTLTQLRTDKESHVLTCPNCNHSWLKDNYDDKINKTEELYLNLQHNYSNATERLVAVKQERETCCSYLEQIRNYQQLRAYLLNPKWFWEPIDNKLLIRSDPISIYNKLYDLKVSLRHYEQYKITEARLSELLKQKKCAEVAANDSIEDLTEQLTQLEADIVTLYKEEDHLNDYINTLHAFAAYQRAYGVSKDNFIKLKERKDYLQKQLIKAAEQHLVNEAIFSTKKELAELEQQLHKAEQQDTVIQTLDSNLQLAKEDVLVLTDCVNVLSPKDGLIAATLLKFIQVYVKQINQFIKDIWLYDLIIDIETIIDAGEVDYKFPIVVANNKKALDVRQGSSAMREIFDLAFKIVAMQHLGLMDYPLILDEFANTFDKEHRTAAYNTIASLTSNSGIEQIFIVSHYYDNFGAFNNADRYLLSDVGIDGVNS